jgi:pimeloyl-ACP methyl ester carboxylesterase
VLVETVGTGPRVVLVHGSVGNARSTWSEQAELAERFTLVYVTRTGYPPRPPVERIDFEDEAALLAELIQPGDHVVGHSYGGLISLLAAARRADAVASLTVGEPPAFRVARGNPDVEELVGRLAAFFAAGPYEPADYLRGFLSAVGSAMVVPDPLPPALAQGAQAASVERPPYEAEIPLAELARAAFPKLVVSGGHSAPFDAVCDVLERKLGAQRAVLPGAGHSVQRAPGFNDRLVEFLARA